MRKAHVRVASLACLALAAASSAQPAATGKEAAAQFYPGKIQLALPAVIYAVPGVEMNIYFDNVVLAINPANYAFGVTCDKGIHQAERWTYTPVAADAGDHSLLIEVRDDDNAVVARAKSTVRVVPPAAGAGQSVSFLCIGDSLTQAGVYPRRLLDLCLPEGNPKIKLIGWKGPGSAAPDDVRFEGYGGWTAERYATHYAPPAARAGDWRIDNERGSPFIYLDANGQKKLDFARYCADFNEGSGPDFVTIFLGCNESIVATDANIEQSIDAMLKYYDMLIAMIHGVRKETKIGAVLLIPASASQDAFGADYKCGLTRWQYKCRQCRVVQRMTEHYGGREAENLWLIPANVNLDCVRNFKEPGARQPNGVHPATAGYKQIGDSIYCWMKAQMAGVH